MRTFFLALLAGFVFICAIAWFVVWPSKIKDRVVSSFVSSHLHASLQFHRVSLGWKRVIYFESVDLSLPGDDQKIFSSGRGILRSIPGNDGTFGYFFVAEDAVAHVAFGKELSHFMSWPSNFFENSIGFKRISFYLRVGKKHSWVRALDARASDFSIKGGLMWAEGRPLKVNLLGVFSKEILSKLPAFISKQIFFTPSRHRIHVTYGGETITLSGPNGPIFQFSGKLVY